MPGWASPTLAPGPTGPATNGKAERFNRTLLDEWAYQRPFTGNAERAEALPGWLEYYNTTRRHQARAGQVPISRLSPMR